MHGGAAGSGAPKGNRNAYKTGEFTRERVEEHRQVSRLIKDAERLGRVLASGADLSAEDYERLMAEMLSDVDIDQA